MSNASKMVVEEKVEVAVEDAAVVEVAVVEEVVEVDEDVVDLRLFSPLGRLVHIHLLQLPPQAKEVGGWRMQQGMRSQPGSLN